MTVETFKYGEHMKMLTRLIELRGKSVTVTSSRNRGWKLEYNND